MGRRQCSQAPQPPNSDYCPSCPIQLLEWAETSRSWEFQIIHVAKSTLDDLALGMTIDRDSIPYDEYLTMQVVVEERQAWQEEAEEYSKIEDAVKRAAAQRPFTKVDT